MSRKTFSLNCSIYVNIIPTELIFRKRKIKKYGSKIPQALQTTGNPCILFNDANPILWTCSDRPRNPSRISKNLFPWLTKKIPENIYRLKSQVLPGGSQSPSLFNQLLSYCMQHYLIPVKPCFWAKPACRIL